jgi:class 3 adenylate cyclase/tetratricopeptide (TPR) repeat protein
MTFQNVADIEEALRSGEVTLRELYSIWDQRQPVADTARGKGGDAPRAGAPHIAWMQGDLSLARRFTERALQKEELLLVCDASREALRLWPNANEDERTELVRLRMNYARALMCLGFTRDARRELEPCAEDTFQPKLGRSLKVDILLQLGHIVREDSHHATARAARLQMAEEALGFYQRALQLDPERLEALVSTAGASFIIGAEDSPVRTQAEDKARQILAVTARLEDTEGPRVRTTRARATAYSILGDTEAAARSYGQLKDLDGVTTTDLTDARYYAQFLAEALGKPRDFFKEAFPPLQLIIFSGHLPDAPDATNMTKRFPVESIEPVRKLLKEKLEQLDARVGLVSASAGADLLFIEALRERDGEVHIILPWSQNEFRRTSVEPFDVPGQTPLWQPLFDQAMEEAATVRAIGQVYEPGSSVGWEYLMEVTAGIALNTARASRLDVQPMVLWDGEPGRGAGGTESFLAFWRDQLQQRPVVLDLPAANVGGRGAATRRRDDRSERAIMHQEVKTMLFADIVGYSKLTEHVIPEFVGTFLTRVSQLAADSNYAPLHINTWGDAIYAVFDFAHDAGSFALELTQMIKEGERDWLQKGLYWEEPATGKGDSIKRPLSIRVALHTGPVFMHYNPVVRQLGFTGSHVSRAARIEPVTKAGEVFASEEFAALAELGAEIDQRNAGGHNSPSSARFVCDYAGSMHLAKGYPGRYRIYRVLPKRTFAIEELAEAAHELYLVEAHARGETPQTNTAIRPWAELPEDLKDANRAQVADIPNKLRQLGYDLAPGHGLPASEIKTSDAQIEELAVREHDRWMKDRVRHGWTYAPVRDNLRKLNPLLVPWEKLSEVEKEKDRDTIRNIPRLVQKAGFRVRKIAEV